MPTITRRSIFKAAALAIPASLPTEASDIDSDALPEELPVTAKELAEREFKAVQRAFPSTWESCSYVTDYPIDRHFAAIVCVAGDQRLLGRWASRVDRCMYPGSLMVHDLGKAGQVPGLDDGWQHVTVLIVNRKSLALEQSAFVDLKAKFPKPEGVRYVKA